MVRKSKANSGIKGESITLKKGDRVITTGKGKTKLWGNVVGKALSASLIYGKQGSHAE